MSNLVHIPNGQLAKQIGVPSNQLAQVANDRSLAEGLHYEYEPVNGELTWTLGGVAEIRRRAQQNGWMQAKAFDQQVDALLCKMDQRYVTRQEFQQSQQIQVQPQNITYNLYIDKSDNSVTKTVDGSIGARNFYGLCLLAISLVVPFLCVAIAVSQPQTASRQYTIQNGRYVEARQ